MNGPQLLKDATWTKSASQHAQNTKIMDFAHLETTKEQSITI